MLLLFVAPEVSKMLEHWRMEIHIEQSAPSIADNMRPVYDISSSPIADDMAGMMDGMTVSPAGMTMHHDMSIHTRQPFSMPTMPGMMSGSIMDDMACNYCVMLIHLPLMLWLFFAIIWLIIKVASAPPPRLTLPIFTVFLSCIAQPRAPPVN